MTYHAPTIGRPCPRCDGDTERLRRLLSDRLLSLFVPLVRYRCRSIKCGWEGTLKRQGERQRRRAGAPPAPGTQVLESSRMQAHGQPPPTRR